MKTKNGETIQQMFKRLTDGVQFCPKGHVSHTPVRVWDVDPPQRKKAMISVGGIMYTRAQVQDLRRLLAEALWAASAIDRRETQCGVCDGSRRFQGETCPHCKGTGRKPKERK